MINDIIYFNILLLIHNIIEHERILYVFKEEGVGKNTILRSMIKFMLTSGKTVNKTLQIRKHLTRMQEFIMNYLIIKLIYNLVYNSKLKTSRDACEGIEMILFNSKQKQ